MEKLKDEIVSEILAQLETNKESPFDADKNVAYLGILNSLLITVTDIIMKGIR